ncbi:MAG: HAMP domain-containing histidine kinase, partial [Oscillospiraceae bacterium]|nr:HAMP domain-containing histidine kinase [Oscillospiraceae bacterium]
SIGRIFYTRELKDPIDTLMAAAEKISKNELDFEVYYYKKNELGRLCEAFNEMRRTLYEHNRELWHSLEERKRLNAAFSHDLRTPLTVLRGYADMLEKYAPDGKISEEKLMSVIGKMRGQIGRLENYTAKMNAVHKLDDILPERVDTSFSRLCEQLSETGQLICGENEFTLTADESDSTACVDTELVMQVFENLVSNGIRYAESRVYANAELDGGVLRITVSDDGAGFSAETLKHAAEPFFRGDNEQNKSHFGLGLYICRIICEKCGGGLFIFNSENGGAVTAYFNAECEPLRP